MILKKLSNFLFKPLDVSIVSLFRIVFGAFMTYQMIYYYKIDYTFQFIYGPEVLFPYNGLEFLKPFSLNVLKGIHAALLISSICITIGFLYRYAMIFFFLGFSYFSFVDKTLYNNHIYLISLIAFVLIFIKADKKYSLTSRLSKTTVIKYVPAWNQYILVFLFSVVYFFGGISKLSPNWLDSNLVSNIIEESKGTFFKNLLPDDWLLAMVKYGGLLFDLSISFILINKKTRKIGFVLVLIFSILNNSVLFDDIGIFPFFMICATMVFFDSKKVGDFVDSILGIKPRAKKFRNKEERKAYKVKEEQLSELESDTLKITKLKGATLILLGVFVVFHLLFPLRHFLLTDNPEWTGIASRFSWRMKSQSRKVTEFKMAVKNENDSEVYMLDGKSYLSTNQYMHLPEDPFTVVRLSKYIGQKLSQERGFTNPEIRAKIMVEFNGMPSQHMISPEVDLTNVDENQFSDTSSWIPELVAY